MYLDLLIVINLVINFFLLLAVARLTHRHPSRFRLLLGALGGVLPVIFLTLFPVSQLIWSVFVLITPFFMVGLAFSPVKKREYFIMGGLMFLIAFVICGCITVLHNIQAVNPVSDEPVFFVYLLMICFLVNGVIAFFQPHLEDRKWQGLLRTRVQVCLDDEKQVIDAYLDTGNRVKEPFSKKPVIIVNYLSLKNIIPAHIFKMLRGNHNSVSILESISEPSLACRFYLIPFTGLGGETELLLGFRPDNITILQGEQSREIGSQVAIGIYKRSFNNSEEFQALIPPEVLQLVS